MDYDNTTRIFRVTSLSSGKTERDLLPFFSAASNTSRMSRLPSRLEPSSLAHLSKPPLLRSIQNPFKSYELADPPANEYYDPSDSLWINVSLPEVKPGTVPESIILRVPQKNAKNTGIFVRGAATSPNGCALRCYRYYPKAAAAAAGERVCKTLRYLLATHAGTLRSMHIFKINDIAHAK